MTDDSGGHVTETERFTDRLRREFLHANLTSARTSLLIYFSDGVKVLSVEPGSTYVIGREAPATLVLRDRSLSRQHARVSIHDDHAEIEDLDSTNGTFVNGTKVTLARIGLGDRVTVGAATLMLHVLQAVDGPPAVLESHDRFVQRLEEEAERARQFNRRLAVLMIRALPGPKSHVSFWVQRLEKQLRSIDHAALYAHSCIEVLLPETPREHVDKVAQEIVRRAEGLELTCVYGTYPTDATTPDALIEQLRAGVTRGEAGGVVALSSEDYVSEPAETLADADIVTRSPAMQSLYSEVDRVAPSDLPVLILGETGVGKEVLAQHLHAQSKRSDGVLRAVNCAAIPHDLVESTLFGHERGAFTGATERRAGVFESASGGTVFLDELGELPPGAQAALLRALDTRQVTRVGGSKEIAVDVRIIAATNRDLEAMCEEGTFREDLLYRLNTVTFEVPPLRQRRDELDALVAKLAALAAANASVDLPRFSDEALAALKAHAWPGNVRELRNVLERAVVMCRDGVVTPDDFPASLRSRAPVRQEPEATAGTAAGATAGSDADYKERVKKFETDLLLDALRACDGNQTRAAEYLGMPRRTLVHKLKTLGLSKSGVDEPDDD